MTVIIFTVLGLVVGSFLNVCIDRLPEDKSIIRPPSSCSSCGHKLSVADLIPLVSYIWLRGECRYCAAHIPLRIPVVEGVTALIFGFLAWNYGLSLQLTVYLIFSSILIIIFFIDLEHQLVLDVVSYPSMLAALIISFFWTGVRPFSIFLPQFGLENALAGAGTGALMLAIPYVLSRSRGGMGFGDIKLGILLGLMTGVPMVIMAILISWISGGLVGGLLLALKIKGRKDAIPFAPFLVMGTWITLVWGNIILTWYLR